MSSSTLSVSIAVNDSQFAEDFDLRINVRKPIGQHGYSVVPPSDSVGIAYIGADPIEAKTTLQILDRSEFVNENSKYFFGAQGEEVITNESSYTTTSSDIEGTNVFLPVVDPKYPAKPAWYRHELPSDAIAAKLNRAMTGGGVTPVSPFDYSVSIAAKKLYAAVRNAYDVNTGAFEIFFVDITLSDGSSKRELLQGDSVFHEATIDDLDLTTGELIDNSGAYTKSQNGTAYTYTFSKSGRKVIREKRRARIYPRVEDNILLDDPWTISISNGQFNRAYNDFLYEYTINEFSQQVYSPYYPYMLRNSESADVLGEHLIKVSKSAVFNNVNNLHIDVIVKNSEGTVKSAISSRSTASLRPDYDWIVSTNFSVDMDLGLIFNFDVDVKVGDEVEVTYFYEARDYEFTDLELNPYRNPGVEDFMWVIYVVPNVITGFDTLYYLKVDKSNVIVDASQQSGQHDASFPADFLNMSRSTTDDLFNVDTVVGMFYRNYGLAESGDQFWVDSYSSEGANPYQYQILAEITYANDIDADDYSTIDTRVIGGGIRASQLEDGLMAAPVMQHVLPELGNPVTGIPYPGHYASLVRIPYTMLDTYGGSFTFDEVEERLYRHAPSGSFFIIEVNGVIPRICAAEPGDNSGEIKITWAVEAPGYQYNVYVGQTWRGPFVSSTDSGLLYNSSPITLSSYTLGACAEPYVISGLTPGQPYKVAVTAVDSVTGIESPASVVYEVIAATNNRIIPDVWSLLTYDELILITGVEGQQEVVQEGGAYAWSDEVDVGWIRKEAYDLADANLAVKFQVGGDILPSAEIPALTHSTSNGGTITTDGVKVTNDGMVQTDSMAFYFGVITPINSSLVEGYFQVLQTTSTDAINRAHLKVQGAPGGSVQLNLYDEAAGAARLVNGWTNAALGTITTDRDLKTEEMAIEIVTDITGDTIQVFFNREANPSLQMTYTDQPSTGGTTFILGDATDSSDEGSQITSQDVKIIRLT